MNTPLKQHYRQLFQQHGDSAQAVQYSDETSQHNRFRVLSEVAADLGSVADLGCGLGHLCSYLRGRGFAGRYLGLDFVDEFVSHAAARHANDPETEFRQFDLTGSAYPTGYDTYVICGIFNNRSPGNEEFLRSVLTKAFAATKRQLAFNAMSTYVDFEAPDLYYTDPREVFDFCKTHLTRRVALRHDYLVRPDRPPFEYTVYLYK